MFEYTLFSKDLLDKQEYELAIKTYLKNKGIINYKIVEKEFGNIPMTVYDFYEKNSKDVLHIGTAGGWTKASTGYTFTNISKKTKALVTYLKNNDNLAGFARHNKYRLYDMVMLDVLAEHNEFGAKMFTTMFEKVKWSTIFKFLDENTTLIQELGIITSFPPIKFTKALLKRIFK